MLSVLAFTIIYVTVNIFEEIDNFIDHDAKILDIVRYYIYSIPFILTYIIPVSLLLGTVFAMGVLARRNELTALIASGVSLIRIATPILVTAVLVSLGSAYFNDAVVASANEHLKDIKQYDIEGRARPKPGIKENLHYLGAHGYVYLAATYNHANMTLYDFVVQQFDRNTLIRRIDARKAIWRNGTWTLQKGVERKFAPAEESVRTFDEMVLPEIVETPDDFNEAEIDDDNMTYSELRRYIQRVHLSGGNVRKYLVDLYFKLSFPFAGSIFVLIGVAFASGKRKQSVATGFGLTLVVSFLYYGVLRVGQTLGHNGVIPPLLAAQLGNIIFLVVGLFFLARANR